jgi:serine/threonine protein phosphatase PrpC
MHDLSKTGLLGDDKKVNQDNYFIFKNFVQGLDNIFMGVCDGHGYYGHEISGYIKENLPMNLNNMIRKQKLNVLKDDLAPIIKKAFVLENNSLLRNQQIDSDLSGSTCISVIYTPEKLIIANVGDSRAVLGKLKPQKEDNEKLEYFFFKENKKHRSKWISKDLSRDHKPTIQEEAERIIQKGGRIRPMKDEDGEYVGPLRVYMKNKDIPGLAMTRSFGDFFGVKAGIIAEPEVTEYYFKEEDKFLILASDGLFEFMESQEVVDIVKDYYDQNDIVTCCEYLYKESARKWLKEEDDVIDDITIILVFF